jgi:signal transduction histidine kinase
VERLLAALRRVREVDADDQDTLARETLTRRLLTILRAETSSHRAALRRSASTEEISVGDGAGRSEVQIELRFSVRGAEFVLTLERDAPLDGAEALIAEAVGGEIVLRVEHARLERDAMRAARQLALLDNLQRADGKMVKVSEMADRAALELCGAFPGVHVAIHLLVDERLELVARRTQDTRSDVDGAPRWFVRLPLAGPSLLAQAVLQKKLVLRAVEALSARARAVLEPMGVRLLVVAPLLAGGAAIGTVCVADKKDAPWDADQLGLLEDIASRLAVELAQQRALEEERQRSRDLELINEIGGLIAKQHQLDAVLRTAVNELARVTQVSRVALLLVDEARTCLRTAACTEEAGADIAVPLSSSTAATHVFMTRSPIVIDDTATDARVSPTFAKLVGARAILGVPLISNDEPVGVILMVERRQGRRFTKEEVARATAVANLVSPAIANAKMFDDLRRSYEALARAQADVVRHERLAALGELSAVIAHEVRNPLAVIFNSLGSLARLPLPSPDAKLLLDIVGEEAARLNRIVADLLDFVRPYSSHPRPARVDALVAGAIAGAQRALSRPVANVTTDIALAPNEVVLDGTMIQQALTNLIVNALQATPPTGQVSVRARSDAAGPRPLLRFEVADEGPGVDPKDASRIFQPFFTTKATGTGLGLAVVRRIADALGGSVEVAPGEPVGSVFVLTVPGEPIETAGAARKEAG